MKTLITTFILLTLAITCKSQTSNNNVILSGEISNLTEKTLSVYSSGNLIDKLIVSEEGTFRDTLRLADTNHMLYLDDGENTTQLYISRGNELGVSYNLKDYPRSIKMTGKDAEINIYSLHKKDVKQKAINKFAENVDDLFSLEETKFKETINKVKDSLVAYIDSFKNISNEYKVKEKRNLRYEYLLDLSNYQSLHAFYTKNQSFEISRDFLNELENLDYNNEEDFNFSNAYVNLVTNHYFKLGNGSEVSLLKAFSKAKSNLIKNELLYKLTKQYIKVTPNLENFYAAFMAYSTNEKHKAEITSSYNKLSILGKGKPSPKFVDYENYLGTTTSLDDFKGKYVYIDVWATWCTPCIAQIPFLKEIEKKYHNNKNIEFVSISIDKIKDRNKWRTTIVKKELGGIQLLADNEFKSKFIKDYYIEGIPRFILINPEGNIIDANAPMPSQSEKLIQLFNEYKI